MEYRVREGNEERGRGKGSETGLRKGVEEKGMRREIDHLLILLLG